MVTQCLGLSFCFLLFCTELVFISLFAIFNLYWTGFRMSVHFPSFVSYWTGFHVWPLICTELNFTNISVCLLPFSFTELISISLSFYLSGIHSLCHLSIFTEFVFSHLSFIHLYFIELAFIHFALFHKKKTQLNWHSYDCLLAIYRFLLTRFPYVILLLLSIFIFFFTKLVSIRMSFCQFSFFIKLVSIRLSFFTFHFLLN